MLFWGILGIKRCTHKVVFWGENDLKIGPPQCAKGAWGRGNRSKYVGNTKQRHVVNFDDTLLQESLIRYFMGEAFGDNRS